MRGDLTREVIQTVIDAGPDGISSRGVVDVLGACDIPGTRAAIRSILSRARYAGALTYDGLYRAEASVPTKAELEMMRLRNIMLDVAHTAATLGSGSDGWLRGRFMSISNQLNAAIGRQQSLHGDQFDEAGKVARPDPLNS